MFKKRVTPYIYEGMLVPWYTRDAWLKLNQSEKRHPRDDSGYNESSYSTNNVVPFLIDSLLNFEKKGVDVRNSAFFKVVIIDEEFFKWAEQNKDSSLSNNELVYNYCDSISFEEADRLLFKHNLQHCVFASFFTFSIFSSSPYKASNIIHLSDEAMEKINKALKKKFKNAETIYTHPYLFDTGYLTENAKRINSIAEIKLIDNNTVRFGEWDYPKYHDAPVNLQSYFLPVYVHTTLKGSKVPVTDVYVDKHGYPIWEHLLNSIELINIDNDSHSLVEPEFVKSIHKEIRNVLALTEDNSLIMNSPYLVDFEEISEYNSTVLKSLGISRKKAMANTKRSTRKLA